MAKKGLENLPVVLQTTAIKNFFESTVDQLYSTANTEILKGYIGKESGEDISLSGAFLPSADIDKNAYSLSPAINNLNPITGDSENIIFYDELINILKSFGVNVRNHNTLFASNYQTFMPPINVDKLVNFSEYFQSITGPSTITITPTASLPVNLDKDVRGLKQYTPTGGKAFRNGMIVSFTGDYVIPASQTSTEFVVGGVGESITLTPKPNAGSID